MELNKKINDLKTDLIKSTQKLIRIKSVESEPKEGMPFGEGVAQALNCALSIGKKLGFKTKNLDGYVGYVEYGEGEEYIGVLGHLDVVPEGEGWSHPPYAAEIHEGKIYGRGALDDKGPIIAALYGLKAIKDINLPLKKKVRIIFGTNEETGSKEMKYYLEREKPPVAGFTPDAEYPLIFAEKGILNFNIKKELKEQNSSKFKIQYIKGGQRLNMVPDYCEAGIASKEKDYVIKTLEKFKNKSNYDLTAHIKSDKVVIKSVGVSAHGSTPAAGKNAIMQMLKFIEFLCDENGDRNFYEISSFLNEKIGFEVNGQSCGIGFDDEDSGKLTLNVGTIDAEEDNFSMGINIRYPVTYKLEELINPLKDVLEKGNISIQDIDNKNPLYYPKDHPLIKTLLKVYNDQTGEDRQPIAIGGGTYAKKMPNIVAFGPIFPGKPDLDHQVNEYIEIEDLVMNAKIYANAIYELAKK